MGQAKQRKQAGTFPRQYTTAEEKAMELRLYGTPKTREQEYQENLEYLMMRARHHNIDMGVK